MTHFEFNNAHVASGANLSTTCAQVRDEETVTAHVQSNLERYSSAVSNAAAVATNQHGVSTWKWKQWLS